MMQNIDDEFLVRFIFRMTNDAENELVLKWLKEDDANASRLSRLVARSACYGPLFSDTESLNKGASKLIARMKRRRLRPIVWKVAAIVVGVAILAAAGLMMLQPGEITSAPLASYNAKKAVCDTIESPKGVVTPLTLSDGTHVWLAPLSKLVFPSSFDGDVRKVYLTGQAYFEVKHSSSSKFIVRTPNSEIKVLGTKFNVLSYSSASKEEVTLLHGSVEVGYTASKTQSKSIMLTPNQKVSYSIVRDSYEVVDADANTDLAWKSNRIAFKNETFAEICKKIEITKDKVIVLEDNELSRKRFTGSFTNESLEQMLNSFKIIVPFNYKIVKNVAYITSSPMT